MPEGRDRANSAMARLVVKFESQVLREVPLGASPLTIGRAPDNDLHIDNLAVSDHHAPVGRSVGKVQDSGQRFVLRVFKFNLLLHFRIICSP